MELFGYGRSNGQLYMCVCVCVCVCVWFLMYRWCDSSCQLYTVALRWNFEFWVLHDKFENNKVNLNRRFSKILSNASNNSSDLLRCVCGDEHFTRSVRPPPPNALTVTALWAVQDAESRKGLTVTSHVVCCLFIFWAYKDLLFHRGRVQCCAFCL